MTTLTKALQTFRAQFTILAHNSLSEAKFAVPLTLVCGLLTVLNQTTFGLSPTWKTSITWALGLFAFLGIGPAIGPKFRALLHLPPWGATIIGVVLMVGMVVTQTNVSMPGRAVIIGVIQVAGGLGFAPAYVPTVMMVRRRVPPDTA